MAHRRDPQHRHARGRLLVLGLAALALQASTATPAADGGKSILWRVESPTTKLYLLGSVHVRRFDPAPLAPAVEHAWAAARVALFETDLDQLDSAAVKLLAAAALPEGTTLAAALPPELYQKTTKLLESYGLPVEGFAGTRPWMVALALTSLALEQAGYGPENGVDIALFRRAQADGKAVSGLESIDDQVALFASLTPEQGVAFLRYTLTDLEQLEPLLAEMMAAWRTGNAAALAGILDQGFADFPELYRTTVVDRNRAWLPSLERLLAGDQPAFVVVGALHLVGPDGLVEQLRAAGYAVDQL